MNLFFLSMILRYILYFFKYFLNHYYMSVGCQLYSNKKLVFFPCHFINTADHGAI